MALLEAIRLSSVYVFTKRNEDKITSLLYKTVVSTILKKYVRFLHIWKRICICFFDLTFAKELILRTNIWFIVPTEFSLLLSTAYTFYTNVAWRYKCDSSKEPIFTRGGPSRRRFQMSAFRRFSSSLHSIPSKCCTFIPFYLQYSPLFTSSNLHFLSVNFMNHQQWRLHRKFPTTKQQTFRQALVSQILSFSILLHSLWPVAFFFLFPRIHNLFRYCRLLLSPSL